MTDSLKEVTNCWTIYHEQLEDGSRLANIGRPQDWGDPKWMHRVYVLEAQGYRNTVHCWIDAPLNEHEHLETFSSLICQIMLPGIPEQISGTKFMAEDDFWKEAWGEMPEHWDEDEDLD